jgi:zinc transporter ZupT
MICVLSNDIVPEAHGRGDAELASAGLMVGLALMMLIDLAFI